MVRGRVRECRVDCLTRSNNRSVALTSIPVVLLKANSDLYEYGYMNCDLAMLPVFVVKSRVDHMVGRNHTNQIYSHILHILLLFSYLVVSLTF